jgi:hypothetical protein
MYLGVIRSRPTAYSKVTIQHNHLNRKNIIIITSLFPLALQPNVGYDLLVHEVS